MSRISGVMFIIDDDERTRAKQQAMLDVDESYAKRWVTTMRELVDEGLADQEFTERRMSALKLWEKGRKREQRHLHYAYDPRRRNPKLIERDIEKLREKLDAGMARIAARKAAREAEAASNAEPATAEDVKRRPADRGPAKARPATKRTPVRSLDGIPPSTIEMMCADLGVASLEYMTDDDVRHGYVINLHLTEEQAQNYVDILNGKPNV